MKTENFQKRKPGAAIAVIFFIFSIATCSSIDGRRTEKISGRTVEYAVNGEGSPAVVFENGLGAQLEVWKPVFNKISRRTTTFAYNRPGYGNSIRVSTPRIGKYMIIELRELLKEANISPPYILVGHSFGGLLMQLFARQYPHEVAALVLVDSTHPEHFTGKGSPENWPRLYQELFKMATTDIEKEEFRNINKTGEEVMELPAPYGFPVVILSAFLPMRETGELADYQNQKRKELSDLYPGSKQVWVNSGHNIPKEKPDIIIEIIENLLQGRN